MPESVPEPQPAPGASPGEPSPGPPRRGVVRWPYALVAAGLLAGGVLWADWYRAAPPQALATATYVGRQSCVECHQQQHDEWVGSHHDWAMDTATDQTVLADFDNSSFTRNGVTTRFFRDGERFMVNAEGPDGEMTDFEVKYTFGVEPLQQYMVEFPDGRVQVLRVSWDTVRQEWFEVTPPDVPDERILPGDPLHWTGIGQNWNTTCAECHSTNLQKNYNLESDTYHTTFSEIDVSCEECHGPASLHVELATAKSFFWDRRHGLGLAKLRSADPTAQLEACAKCHSRRNAVHADFRPGTPLLDSFNPSLLHAGLYHADGQILDEVYVYGSFLQSKMHSKGVRCTDCHNPHSLERKFVGNALCTQCHEPAKYDVFAHHRHPLPSGSVASVEGSVEGTGTACVDCHMPATTYMNVDPRRDHSFRVPRPDLTVSVGSPNACNGCHQAPGEDAAWAAAKVVEWYGDKRPDDPHWAPAIAAGRDGDPRGEKLLIDLVRRDQAPAIVRATGVELLGQYASEAAQREVKTQLESLDPMVRAAAARSVQPPTADRLIGTLVDSLQDPSRTVRGEVARRLAGAPRNTLTGDQLDALNEALVDYRHAQSLQAERAGAHVNLAEVATRLGDDVGAVSALRTAVRLEPYLTGPRSQLALALSRAGGSPEEIQRVQREEIENLRRDVEFLPENPPTHYQLGMLLYQVGELAEAEDALLTACRLAPQTYQFRMALALLQERRYELTGEEQHFRSAVDSLRELEKLNRSDQTAMAILQRLLATRRGLKLETSRPVAE